MNNYVSFILVPANDEVRRFIDYMKPRILRADFVMVIADNISAEISRMFFYFLEGKRITNLSLYSQIPGTIDFTHWLDIIQKFVPSTVDFNELSHTNETLEFLINIADTVNELSVSFVRDSASTDCSIIRTILTRKCERLTLDKLSIENLKEIEKLIEFFHHIDKKVRLEAEYYHGPSIDSQVGEYKVGNGVAINHLEIHY